MSIAINPVINETLDGKAQLSVCYHCGAECLNERIAYNKQVFCCEGCKLVYEILSANDLCNYYELQTHPGLKQIKPLRRDKFAYLDEQEIAKGIYSFFDGKNARVTFFVPSIHCSSCMWLLEHLYRLQEGIKSSRVNFSAKEITIEFLPGTVSLRRVVELLATIGYEPAITRETNNTRKTNKQINRGRLYKLGVAGFCFGNIMLMSFPEYLSGSGGIAHEYAFLFRTLNLLLSLPVVFYAASEFFYTAWKGLQQKTLNIDAPIALAIIITYSRSLYEILSGIGGGYLDSMSGIVFFMLVGRFVQERTNNFLTFHRDYKAYFPIAATVLKDGKTHSKPIAELEQYDVVKIYNEEIIPADGKLISGAANIDYSFVSGENDPVSVAAGEKLYAGGRQSGGALLMEVIKPVSSSYLTSLWNHKSFSVDKTEENSRTSFIHLLSKYFTIVLFSLAAITALYWSVVNPAMVLPSVSAMLIVACPCALLLTATYTNGNVLRILSDNGLYLRDGGVIEQLGGANHIVFDKTGTLTSTGNSYTTSGYVLSKEDLCMVYSVAKDSSHPKSRELANNIGSHRVLRISGWNEVAGKGVEGEYDGYTIKIGSAAWVGATEELVDGADVLVSIDGRITAFHWQPLLRSGITELTNDLKQQYHISLLSGDNDRHKKTFARYFNEQDMHFQQQPAAKLSFIEQLQKKGDYVVMIGDGLNDAGALQQSNAGITLADDINNFNPGCDAILQANRLDKLPALLRMSRWSKHIVHISFFVSILYNIAGITISAMGKMNPMIAAILMPLSTVTIVLITTGVSNVIAARLGLNWRQPVH